MFISDPSRPVSLQIVLERFGLADAAKGVAKSLLDQPGQPLENLAVLFGPIGELVGRLQNDTRLSSLESLLFRYA